MPAGRESPIPPTGSLRSGALAQQLCDIEVHEVSMMKDDRLDRALHFVALMTVCGNDVQNCAGNAVFVGDRDAAERMPHLLPEFALDHIARRVLVVLEWLAHVRQQRTCDEVVALNRYATAKRLLEDVGDGEALARARIQMLDEGHLDVAGKEGEFHRTQL